ncbi:hypothetical protein C3F09_02775 [candidate division GN15 bacterium]|uniref:LytR/CpsA/Psr regulator C-terminal domain-containing protein n=1 Tax=candidate division GN15 bacterium TaxID=2072418 RepID=A0A855XAU5_9BACT|nr:MAG: hypothetical protein C3F09_02775 [candidate division GN15 bacterium]
MFQTEPSYSRQSPSSPPDSRPKRRRILSRAVELAMLAIVIGLIGYVGLYVVRVSRGVTKDADVRPQVVRLQVLNGGGIVGLADRMGRQLNGTADEQMEIQVVDVDDIDGRRVKRTFVISRVEKPDAAKALATRLGLDPSEVIYEPLENNIRQVTATLVLGDDYGSMRMPAKQQEK